jgi:hypothetical protein
VGFPRAAYPVVNYHLRHAVFFRMQSKDERLYRPEAKVMVQFWVAP